MRGAGHTIFQTLINELDTRHNLNIEISLELISKLLLHL